MRRAAIILALGLCTPGAPSWAGCVLPAAPSKIPSGNQATETEMMAALQTLKRYNVDVSNYLKCLEFEAQQNRLTRYDQAVRHNAAIDSLESIAGQFNEQLRVFK